MEEFETGEMSIVGPLGGATSVKRGYLNKKGRGQVYRPWSLRMIVLDYEECKLSYYDGNTLKGEVNLRGTSVRQLTPAEADGRSHAFEVLNICDTDKKKSNQLILAAGSSREAADWMEAIASIGSMAAAKSSSSNEYVYESFEALDTKLLPQPIHDAAYYRNLRAKQQEEKMRKQQPHQSIPSSQSSAALDASSSLNISSAEQTEPAMEISDNELNPESKDT